MRTSVKRSLSILFWFIFFFVLAAFIGGIGAFERWRHEPVKVTLETDALSGPRDALVVDFSRAVDAASLTGKISLTPVIPFATEWHDFGKRLVITPDENWALDMRYQLGIGQGKTSVLSRTPIVSFAIDGPKLPKLLSVSPTDGARDVILGVEDPIRVEFDRSVKDFYIDFRFDPAVAVVYQNNPEKTIFDILPSEELQPGKPYQLSIETRFRNADDEAYQPIGKTVFTTLPPRPVKAASDFATRIEEAKRFTRAKERAGKYIDVNLSAQVMTLFEDGRAVDAYIISSGKRGMDTPTGTFAIENKALRPWSKKYSLYMPYWQAITPDGKYGIHELPEWPGGYKEGANHLGTPVSHGCMRLGIGSAKRVYEWAPVGTPVMVY